MKLSVEYSKTVEKVMKELIDSDVAWSYQKALTRMEEICWKEYNKEFVCIENQNVYDITRYRKQITDLKAEIDRKDDYIGMLKKADFVDVDKVKAEGKQEALADFENKLKETYFDVDVINIIQKLKEKT